MVKIHGYGSNINDQLKVTNHVLCKMTDQWVLNLKLLLISAVSLDMSPSPGLLLSHWWDISPALRAPLASFTLKVLLNTTRKVIGGKVKCHNEVSHLQNVVDHLTKYLFGQF